jgi:hypothetical protein
LPAGVRHALERLSALSTRVPQTVQPADVRTPSAPPPPMPVKAAVEREPQRAVVVPPRLVRDEPTLAPTVHIASIEVTVAAPAPPAPPTPPQLQPAAPAPVGRLSRQPARFGFGQG